MVEAPHPRAWRIAAPALLLANVLGGAVGGLIVGTPVALASSAQPLASGSLPFTLLVAGVALLVGAVGGLLGGGALVLARGARPTRRTLVRGLAAGVAIVALVAAAALLVPVLPDASRPLALAVGLGIGAGMLGLAFRAHEVHWREGDHAPHAPATSTPDGDPIADIVDPDAAR